MKRIAAITFHSSYNYGSNLQAYALQEYVKNLTGRTCEYKIINLRKTIQREMYKSVFERTGLANRIRQLVLHSQKDALRRKQVRFEQFISENLQLTKEYSTLDELREETFNFDYYISGSDQLWNLTARDFDWAYYLEFVKRGKKISYSASFGPRRQHWNEDEQERVKNDLLQYDNISVREKGSFDNVRALTGIEPEIHVDPTMLLTRDEWLGITETKPLLNYRYILFYNVKVKREVFEIAKKVSRQLGIPVVTTRDGGKHEWLCGFKRFFDVGPLEFLNLIHNAHFVLSSSFHGTIFAMLFGKPFFAINGKDDFRIATLLERANLVDRAISVNDIDEKCKDAFSASFEGVDDLINAERNKSRIYLTKALELES
jgi:hypothetical protein